MGNLPIQDNLEPGIRLRFPGKTGKPGKAPHRSGRRNAGYSISIGIQKEQRECACSAVGLYFQGEIR
jgi:hypothetical protein